MITDLSTLFLLGMMPLIVCAWVWLFRNVAQGNGVLPFEPRPVTPWGVVELALAFLLLLGSQVVLVQMFGRTAGDEATVAQSTRSLLAMAVTLIGVTIVAVLLVRYLAPATWYDLGLSLKRFWHDVGIGIGAFLILGPLAYGIQFVFVYLLQIKSQHPLIELLKQDSSGQLFGLVALLAIVVAPVTEEFFFRVLLQGWLERHFLFEPSDQASAFEDLADSRSPRSENPNAFSHVAESHQPPAELRQDYFAQSAPIVISSAIFALMHWVNGPDPAALFVFALGLGYLYQRTHRWLPSVVTHLCLNGTTILILWLGLDRIVP